MVTKKRNITQASSRLNFMYLRKYSEFGGAKYQVETFGFLQAFRHTIVWAHLRVMVFLAGLNSGQFLATPIAIGEQQWVTVSLCV